MATRKTRAPRREAPDLTDAQLDDLAVITPEDIERAAASWRRHASPEFRDLLDATPVDPDDGDRA